MELRLSADSVRAVRGLLNPEVAPGKADSIYNTQELDGNALVVQVHARVDAGP